MNALQRALTGRDVSVKRNTLTKQWALVFSPNAEYPAEETLIFQRLPEDQDKHLVSAADTAGALIEMLPTVTLEAHCLCCDFQKIGIPVKNRIPVRAKWVKTGLEAGLGPQAGAVGARVRAARAQDKARREFRSTGQVDWCAGGGR
jgi:hypothetical protein